MCHQRDGVEAKTGVVAGDSGGRVLVRAKVEESIDMKNRAYRKKSWYPIIELGVT